MNIYLHQYKVNKINYYIIFLERKGTGRVLMLVTVCIFLYNVQPEMQIPYHQ